ncbi:S58 family peptidase [Ktedonosporobacter rubrisoli]|uniref:S58 family peptidase n=1 Tax=Ktedonosporobacter rubrisoli TaxID=2509675 RepID=A0A4P6JR29_KTERU|nr:P1 family peptidase [Ktedonosporobacter rubrisoli]QBD77733.1 S58 family peptidase [Ktedonosporobacter rubrisoli]
MPRMRLRDLGIRIGRFPTGVFNAITDVPGILVGHKTLIHDEPRVARTGVTMIVPRNGEIWQDHAFAGYFSFNGCGEMSGVQWVEESGKIHTPIGITNTNSVGTVRDAIAAYPAERRDKNLAPAAAAATWDGTLPVAAETWDGWLSDINAFHIAKEHVFEALESAQSGPVAEGNVGGGTGMICHEFKGGIGTSSRLVECPAGQYTVGALVQANYGDRHLLRVNGVAVGRELGFEHVPSPWIEQPKGGSIIVIVATDAPLLPVQCKRLARRATVGLARVGGVGSDGSGDIFLAFATGNHLPYKSGAIHDVKMLSHDQLTLFFEATAEAVEEAILNVLTSAETMTGWRGRTAYALPLDELRRVMGI